MLAACGGGGTDTPSASTAQSDNTTQQAVMLKAADYRAALLNDRHGYSYLGQTAPEPDASTSINKEVKTIDGVEGLVVESYWGLYTSQSFESLGSDGWISESISKYATTKFNKVKKLPATFKIGDRFVMGDENHPNEYSNGGIRFHADAIISGLETITTPAGTFQNCVKVSIVETSISTSTNNDGTTSSNTSELEYAIWYAPGAGQVLMAYIDRDTQSQRPSWQLVAYQINGVRSETVRPVASLKSSPSESNHGQFKEITVQFSEPMQGLTLDNKIAVITDPQGNVVPGQFSFTDTTWTFRPDYPSLKLSGQYQIQLTDLATDQAGNPVIPATWTVFVDATPPKLVKAEFVDGQIILTFDEDFLPMPGLDYITLFSNTDGGMLLADLHKAQFAIESNRIILGTKGGYMDLKYGATYHVQIDNNAVGLVDLANNVTPRDIATITIPTGPY